jgi:hypothetical protein
MRLTLNARVHQVFSGCIDCILALGSTLEEEDGDLLLSEVEMLVREKMPAALQVQRCVFTFLRQDDKAKERPQQQQPPGIAAALGRQTGNLQIVSKPVYTACNDLLGMLEVAAEVTEDARDEFETMLELVAHFLGGLCTLVSELGGVKQAHGEASRMVKTYEDQILIYKEAAEKAITGVTLMRDADNHLTQKCEILSALLPAVSDDLRYISAVVAKAFPGLLKAAKVSLYLLADRAGLDGEGEEVFSLTPATSHPVVDEGSKELLDRCRRTRRRCFRSFVKPSDRGEDGGASRVSSDVLILVDDPSLEADTTVVCEPVGDRKGTCWGMLRVEVLEGGDVCGKRDKVLAWAAATVALALEGAERVTKLRQEVTFESWLSGKSRKLLEFLRHLYGRCEATPAPPLELLLQVVLEHGPQVLGAERLALYVMEPNQGRVWGLQRNGERRILDISKSILRRAVHNPAEEIWAVPLASLPEYDPAVDLRITAGGGELLSVLALQQLALSAGGKGPDDLPASDLQAFMECSFSSGRMSSQMLEAARGLAKELGRHVAVILGMYTATDAPLPGDSDPASAALLTRSCWARRGRVSREADVVFGAYLAKEVLPTLLDIPMRSSKIQDLMTAVPLSLYRFLSATTSLGAKSVSVHLFALDSEGLWTVDSSRTFVDDDGVRGILTVPVEGPNVSSILADVVKSNARRIVEDVELEPLFDPEHDLVGLPVTRRRAAEKISMLCIPISTVNMQETEGTKTRGVLRYCVYVGAGSGEEAITPLEDYLLEAIAHILGGAIRLLDTSVATKVRPGMQGRLVNTRLTVLFVLHLKESERDL